MCVFACACIKKLWKGTSEVQDNGYLWGRVCIWEMAEERYLRLYKDTLLVLEPLSIYQVSIWSNQSHTKLNPNAGSKSPI